MRNRKARDECMYGVQKGSLLYHAIFSRNHIYYISFQATGCFHIFMSIVETILIDWRGVNPVAMTIIKKLTDPEIKPSVPYSQALFAIGAQLHWSSNVVLRYFQRFSAFITGFGPELLVSMVYSLLLQHPARLSGKVGWLYWGLTPL